MRKTILTFFLKYFSPLLSIRTTLITKFTVIKVETASKNRFVKPGKLQNRINKGKGKEKKKECGEGKEEKREKQ